MTEGLDFTVKQRTDLGELAPRPRSKTQLEHIQCNKKLPIALNFEIIRRESIASFTARACKHRLPNGYINVTTKLVNGHNLTIETEEDRTIVQLKGTRYTFFNSVVSIVRATKFIHRNGRSDVKFLVRVVFSTGNVEFLISSKKYKRGLLEKIEEECPNFSLNKLIPNYSAIFDIFSQAILEKNSFLFTTVFDFSGWHQNEVGPGWTYLHGNLPNVEAVMKMPLASPADHIAGLNALLALVNRDAGLYIVFLFSHLGFTARLLGMAGLAPRFSLYATGRSGSFKTSLLKLLSGGIFETETDSSCECRFSDTKASINEAILKRIDSLLLIDDLHPTALKGERSAMKANLGRVLRAYGDGETEGKLGPDRKTNLKEKIFGAAWMTGEMVDFSAYSDILRIITVPIDGQSIDLATLTALQDNLDIVRKYFSSYVNFLGPRFQLIVKDFAGKLAMQRRVWRDVLKLSFGRYVDAAVALTLVNYLVWEAAKADGFLNADAGKLRGEQQILSFFKAIIANTELQKPTNIFANAFKEAFHNGQLAIARDRASYNSGVGEGYRDEKNVVLNSGYAKTFFERFCDSHQLTVPPLERAELVAAGIIEPDIERLKNLRKGGQRPSVYAFKNSVLGIENNAEDNERMNNDDN